MKSRTSTSHLISAGQTFLISLECFRLLHIVFHKPSSPRAREANFHVANKWEDLPSRRSKRQRSNEENPRFRCCISQQTSPTRFPGSDRVSRANRIRQHLHPPQCTTVPLHPINPWAAAFRCTSDWNLLSTCSPTFGTGQMRGFCFSRQHASVCGAPN